jgi:hypothetical protein
MPFEGCPFLLLHTLLLHTPQPIALQVLRTKIVLVSLLLLDDHAVRDNW